MSKVADTTFQCRYWTCDIKLHVNLIFMWTISFYA